MLLKFYFILMLVNSIQCQSAFKSEANPKLCNFFDTINITSGYQSPDDDSITFNKIKFAKNSYGTFTYMYSANHEKITVSPHIRGCICNYKNCVRLCCPQGDVLNKIEVGNRLQHKCVPNNEVPELILKDRENIAFVSEKPCDIAYWIEPDDDLNKWHILPNGSLVLGESSKKPLVVDRDEYCIAFLFDNVTGQFNTNVTVCIDADYPDGTLEIAVRIFYPAMMLVTVVFLSLTLFVYFWIEDLRTLHGKTFMCYVASFIIGYSLLAFTNIDLAHAYKGLTSCIILAEITHTAFIGGFIWLGIIGYDIWRAVGRANQRRHQFLKYCLFAFGTTFLIISITNIFDHIDLLNEYLRPGLGITVCWLQDSKIAHFLYLYSIIIIIIIINTVFFILTKRKIECAQKLSKYATSSDDSKKFAREETDTDRYQLLFRLIIIMGLPWSIEIISWLTGGENILIYIVDTVTMLIGPIIFFISVKKPRVKRLMEDKWSTMTTLRTSLSKLGIGSADAVTPTNSSAQ